MPAADADLPIATPSGPASGRIPLRHARSRPWPRRSRADSSPELWSDLGETVELGTDMGLEQPLHRAAVTAGCEGRPAVAGPPAPVRSAAISAAARAGQVTQTSRSCRASRNTSVSARARSISSPFSFWSRMRRSCAFSTSLAVLACRNVVPPPTAAPPAPVRAACRRRRRPPPPGRVSASAAELCGSWTGRSSQRAGRRWPPRRCCHRRCSTSRSGGLRLLDRATRQADMRGVLALAHALHRALRLSFKIMCLSS